jgi:cytochrome c553
VSHARSIAKVCGGLKARIVPAFLALAILSPPPGGAYLLGSDVAEPPVRIPSNVAWTARTIAMASSGDALRGLLIGRRCDRCHGREGFSSSPSVPNLAGMDRLVVWKQLDDFRSGKRSSPVMQPIANSLSLEDSADVAAYYWMMPIAPDPQDDRAFPQSLSDPKHEAVAGRLITAGDGNRGLPPCQACHGPIGFVTGAPSLATQNATYLLEQIEGFASGRRANDINLRMRSIAVQLTDEERHALAEFYGAGLAESSARPAGR